MYGQFFQTKWKCLLAGFLTGLNLFDQIHMRWWSIAANYISSLDIKWNLIFQFVYVFPTYFKIAVNSHSRRKHSCNRFNTRLSTKKFRNWRFLFLSTFNSLIHCNWAKFRTCVPQHKLLSMPSITITRMSPTWSFGKPFVARVIWSNLNYSYISLQ